MELRVGDYIVAENQVWEIIEVYSDYPHFYSLQLLYGENPYYCYNYDLDAYIGSPMDAYLSRVAKDAVLKMGKIIPKEQSSTIKTLFKK